MHASVRAFLNEILDYAGLFPPAKLPLADALRNYLRYRKESPYTWMLGRFVCPTPRLQDLLAIAKGHGDASLLSLTALGQSSQASEFLAALLNDIDEIQKARRAWGDDRLIDTMELALPKDADIADLAPRKLFAAIAELGRANLHCFFEVPFTENWRRDVKAVCEVLGADPLTGMSGIGLKLRTGGVTAEAFPGEAQIAFFLDRCRSANLPWKATAGLHHPRRHWDASVNLWHHGFLNVFGAGLLARTNPLTEADLVEILADREGTHFRFEPERFAWKGWSCSTAQITEYRASGATTFGSCSFTEPCEDLIAMGLLD